MKTTLGELRQMIYEIAGGYIVGHWYTWDDARGKQVMLLRSVGQVGGTKTVILASGDPGGYSVTRGFDDWVADRPIAALPHEIEQAKASNAADANWQAKSVDTSKEGT